MPAISHLRGPNPGPCHAYQTDRITSPSDQPTSTMPALFSRTLTSQMTNIITASAAAPLNASCNPRLNIGSAHLGDAGCAPLRLGQSGDLRQALENRQQNLVDQIDRYGRDQRPSHD